MEFKVSNAHGNADGLIIGVFADDLTVTGTLGALVAPHITPLIESKVIEGKLSSVTCLIGASGTGFSNLIIVGLGDKAKLTVTGFRSAVGDAVRAANGYKLRSVELVLPEGVDTKAFSQAASEAVVMGLYHFDQFKTEKKILSLSTVILVSSDADAAFKGAADGEIIANAVNNARDLANTPPNVLYPKTFVDRIKEMFNHLPDVSVNVIDAAEAKILGMNTFLGVAQGSAFEPYMVVLEYAPQAGQAPICFVGKGVTFDTGGISIKPSKGMGDMKGDMSGAANVVSALKAIAELKIKRNVTVVTPLVENMPSSKAQRPGDIVTAMNGKTIEITNTDAEGRLILCDALAYAVEKIKPSEIIDMATLTGACVVALGTFVAGIMGNSQEMATQMSDIGHATGERVWQLPLFDEYIDYLKSDVADINHCNEGREGGSITAAKFLEQFVGKTPWLHMDIAGVMDYSKTSGYRVKGMSGEGTRNLIEYVIRAK